LTNYKKLKIAATQQLYKQKTQKTMKIFPSFFTSYSSFIRTSAIISKYLAKYGSLCLY